MATVGDVDSSDALPPGSGEVRVLENFVTPEQCAHLISKFGSKCELSKVVNPLNGQSAEAQPKWRTSTSALMYQSDRDPVVMEITEKVANLCRLPTSHVEVLQLVRYEKGQQYTPHRDYFEPNFKGQNRIFTILIYLTGLEAGEGGRTIFPELGIEVVPKAGSCVFWRNCLDDGTLLPNSLHTGEVLSSDDKIKFAVNCWIRNGPILY
jgi:prolyl 4-hydroxylase